MSIDLKNAKHPPLIEGISLGPIPLLGISMAQRHVGPNCEFGSLLIPSPDDPLSFVDIYFPDQTCSPGAVNFDVECVADFYDKWLKVFPNGFVPVWHHSHHNMGTTPSSTDEDTFSDTYGTSPFSIMLITNNKGEDYCRIRTTNSIGNFAMSKQVGIFEYPGDLAFIPTWREGQTIKEILSSLTDEIEENIPKHSASNGFSFSVPKLIKEVLNSKNTKCAAAFQVFTSPLSKGECYTFLNEYLLWSLDQKASEEAATLWATYTGVSQKDRELLDSIIRIVKKPSLASNLKAFAEEAAALTIFPRRGWHAGHGHRPTTDGSGLYYGSANRPPSVGVGIGAASSPTTNPTSDGISRNDDILRRHGLAPRSGPIVPATTQATNLLAPTSTPTPTETPTPPAPIPGLASPLSLTYEGEA